MDPGRISVCILRTGGTNCDLETRRVFEELGVHAKVVRSSNVLGAKDLLRYDMLVFPGGFSYGDYVRAGAIWGKEIRVKFGAALTKFVESGRPILGICNGFQVLVETGLLPAFQGGSEYPEIALATNISARYECRWVARDEYLYLKNENKGNCVYTRTIPEGQLLRLPIGHGEGRVLFPEGREEEYLETLTANDQLVFRFVKSDGSYPNGEYPFNPNGSVFDITGICNPAGTVLGLMPHPERAFYGWQTPDFTQKDAMPETGDGRLLFESVVEYMQTEL